MRNPTFYVDPLRDYAKGTFCHLATNGTVADLHAFAEKAGIKRCWFHNPRRHDCPHYDLSPANREKALAAGAVECRFILQELERLKNL